MSNLTIIRKPYNKLSKSERAFVLCIEEETFTDTLKEIYQADAEIIVHLICNVGYVTFKPNPVASDIYKLAITSKYRNKGYASQLLNSISGDLILEVNERNKQARSLYEKLGFKTVVKINNYYQQDTGIRMFLKRS